MPKIEETKLVEMTVVPNLPVFTDKKSGASTIAFPFKLLSGTDAIVSVTRLDKLPWKADLEIESVTIKFK